MKMKFSLPLAAAAILLTGAPLFAQMTGTSQPEDLDDTQPVLTPDTSHYVPPSRATTVTVTTPAPTTPTLYQRTPQYAQVPNQTASVNPSTGAANDPDGEVVTNVPVGPNELPIGAKLNATLQQPISTQTTLPGSRFTATLSVNVGDAAVASAAPPPSASSLIPSACPTERCIPSAPKSPTSTTTQTPTSITKGRS
jgi:hypothetical protein